MNNIEVESIIYVQVPSLISAHSCGQIGTPFHDGVEMVDVPSQFIANLKKPYIITISGDSMEPTLENGDKVIIDLDANIRTGSVIACFYDGEYFVKRYITKGFSIFLESDNKKYEPIKLNSMKEFQIFGKVCSMIRDF